MIFYKHFHFHNEIKRPYPLRLPSVTLMIEVDDDNQKMNISWAVCSKDDNFSRAIGRSVAQTSMRRGAVLTGDINPDLSLHDNATQIFFSAEGLDPSGKWDRYYSQAIDAITDIDMEYFHNVPPSLPSEYI